MATWTFAVQLYFKLGEAQVGWCIVYETALHYPADGSPIQGLTKMVMKNMSMPAVVFLVVMVAATASCGDSAPQFVAVAPQQPRDAAPAATAAPPATTGEAMAEPATPLPPPTPPRASAPATPTPVPTSTPTPAPTRIPTPTSSGYFPAEDPDRPEIVDLRYSGYAEQPDSRFIVVFDEPVFVVVHIGPDPRVELQVSDASGEREKLQLQTSTSRNRPSRMLEFGPVGEVFTVAVVVVVNDSEALLGTNGEPADVSVDLERHPDAIFLDPDYTDEVQDPLLVRCAAVSELNRVSPVVVRSIKRTDSGLLTDRERSEWLVTLKGEEFVGRLISEHDEIRLEVREDQCSLLWAAEVSPLNSGRRNEWSFEDCLYDRDDMAKFYGEGYVSDLIDMLTRPYLELEVTDRMVLQLMLNEPNPYGNSGHARVRRNACRIYYPQLFSGVWVPVQSPE